MPTPTRHRHPRQHLREDRRENVGVGVGAVEFQLNSTLSSQITAVCEKSASPNITRSQDRQLLSARAALSWFLCSRSPPRGGTCRVCRHLRQILMPLLPALPAANVRYTDWPAASTEREPDVTSTLTSELTRTDRLTKSYTCFTSQVSAAADEPARRAASRSP